MNQTVVSSMSSPLSVGERQRAVVVVTAARASGPVAPGTGPGRAWRSAGSGRPRRRRARRTRTVRETSEIQASVVLTPARRPVDVFIRPKTTHGWRPISVKIQPAELPSSIRIGAAMAIRPNHFVVGARPLRVMKDQRRRGTPRPCRSRSCSGRTSRSPG